MTTPAMAPARVRQPCLFPTAGPLMERLGAGFFAAIPRQPGVYFHYDQNDRLLYIGQSADLRARIGSYRFVTAERQSRRTARLVSRIHRVEWQVCATAEDAIARERELLLEHRPPFNRAGVWNPRPCWVRFDDCQDGLRARLVRDEPEEEGWVGPLPASFRYAFSALLRGVIRWRRPDTGWWQFPCGMVAAAIPPEQWIPFPNEGTAGTLRQFVLTGCPELIDRLTSLLPGVPEGSPGHVFLTDDLESLRKYARLRTDSNQ